MPITYIKFAFYFLIASSVIGGLSYLINLKDKERKLEIKNVTNEITIDSLNKDFEKQKSVTSSFQKAVKRSFEIKEEVEKTKIDTSKLEKMTKNEFVLYFNESINCRIESYNNNNDLSICLK